MVCNIIFILYYFTWNVIYAFLKSIYYLFNTGSTTANVKLFSVNDTFDMNILKNTNVSIDGASVTVQDNGIIKGFQAGVSLPAGTNTIGKVGLETSVSNALNTINSNLSEEKQQTTFIQNLTNQILESCSNMEKTLGVSAGCYPSYENKISSLNIDNYEGQLIIVHFSYLFNDGCDVDIKVGSDTILTIYSGEQLGDLEIDVPEGENLTIVKSSTATAEDTVNIRCKYYNYTY